MLKARTINSKRRASQIARGAHPETPKNRRRVHHKLSEVLTLKTVKPRTEIVQSAHTQDSQNLHRKTAQSAHQKRRISHPKFPKSVSKLSKARTKAVESASHKFAESTSPENRYDTQLKLRETKPNKVGQ